MRKTLYSLIVLFFGFSVYAYPETGKVGTPHGTFSVTGSGAAAYQIDIDVPSGGGLTPAIGIAYNSQSGNGLAGYGFSVSGISCITRGSKDLYHDGVQKGASYGNDDAFFLDGTRLLLQSGTAGCDGAVYSPEGSPLVKVTVHGDCKTSSCWFEVQTADGTIYQYGNSASSRLKYINFSMRTHVAAWYISSAENPYTDYVTYTYAASSLTVRPVSITYGTNRTKSRGITNTISFSYSPLGANSTYFTLGSLQGKIDVKLTDITVSSNSQTYRRYLFTYNDTGDGSSVKFSRLVQVDEENGKGERLSPVKIGWNYLPDAKAVSSAILGVKTAETSPLVKETSKSFFAADVNNDGISDVFRLSSVEVTTAAGPGFTQKSYDTYLYVSLSGKGSNGAVTYTSPRRYSLGASLNIDDIKCVIGGMQAMDFDGDGYNDIIIPVYNKVNGNRAEVFKILFGKDITSGAGTIKQFSTALTAAEESPLFTTFDTNGDGKDDVFFIENKAKDGCYNGAVVRYAGGTKLDRTAVSFKFDDVPQKVFAADFNGDGLNDLIFFYDGGYKIYFNNGGTTAAVRFSETNTSSGTDFGDCFRIEQGDFDGDGLTDFLYYIKDCDYNLAMNNGNGTFTLKPKAFTVDEIQNQSTNKDNDRFSLIVYDMDHDGRSDLLACKAVYVHHGGLSSKNSYKKTAIRWMHNTGSTFTEGKAVTTYKGEDAETRNLMLGDFDGDGAVEVASYGTDLYTGSTYKTDTIHVYRTGMDMAGRGRVSYVEDGFGKTVYFSYKSGTDPSVYTRTADGKYPVNEYTLPVSLVSRVNVSGGENGNQVTDYKYGGLKIHMAGKGLIGFTSFTSDNLTLGAKEETTVTKWDETRWIPLETKSVSTLGGSTSTTLSTRTITGCGVKNYSVSASGETVTDYDGNTVEKSAVYDTAKGVPVQETIKNDGGNSMYKRVDYKDYVYKGRRWLPTAVVRTQKHKDDTGEFSTKTTYTYDNNGNVLSAVENDGSAQPLNTSCTYDVYGNVLSTVVSGDGVKANKTTCSYDTSGRFVTRKSETASSAVWTYSYDAWGNVLRENYMPDGQNTLATVHEYDGWGDETAVTDPYGCKTLYERGWGTDSNKKYYILETPSGRPWVKTWYDRGGREVLVETVGPRNASVTKSTSYDSKGNISKTENKTGKLTVSETFTYDGRGRVLTSVSSAGGTSSYSYAGRSVTATVNGRSYTKTTDAWGNVVKSTDPVSEVEYRYSSCGKPSGVSSGGSSVTFVYDGNGNKVSMSDPDAGTTTYTYAADGKVMSETDGRGVETVYTYDGKGRLVSARIGNTSIVNTYGVTGNEAGLLQKSACGNNSVEYTHDRYGRVVMERRNIENQGAYTFSYEYNDKNLPAKTTYPGGLDVTYNYDEYGFKTCTLAGKDAVYSLINYDGKYYSSIFKGIVQTNHTLDDRGLETSVVSTYKGKQYESLTMEYDKPYGNMVSRCRNNGYKETFRYDNMDRLTYSMDGKTEPVTITYSANGNIVYKTGVGAYQYDGGRSHAVMSVGNTYGRIPNASLTTAFNDMNKIGAITDDGSGYGMTLSYGPDGQRWYSSLIKGNSSVRYTVYAGDYEKITEGGVTREFYYLDGNSIVIRQGGVFKLYKAFVDNLGSILSVTDVDGNIVFNASYDAWGRQTVTVNSIGLHRGYCGHETLDEFGIVNMNGRLYDPFLGRFFSPDNYVQLPDNSQSFNRYSYCLNNPLKYTDPDGEWFGIDDLLITGAAFLTGYLANSISTGSWGISSVKAGALSAVTSWLGFNAAGMAAGSITGTTWSQVSNICINGFISKAFPSVTIPLGDKFGISFSPAFGFGGDGFTGGMVSSLYYSDGDWSFSVAGGLTNSYSGWNATASYDGWGGGFGKTYYDEEVVRGNTLGKQIVGTITLLARGDVSFRLSNDMFGRHEYDRWRTSAAELAIGNFSVGTYVTTNSAKKDHDNIDENGRDPILGLNPNILNSKGEIEKYGGAWRDGEFYSAPFWIGFKSGSQIYRAGYSHRYVQSLTQNAVHKYLVKTPFFLGHDHFYEGVFSYSGYNSPLSLW